MAEFGSEFLPLRWSAFYVGSRIGHRRYFRFLILLRHFLSSIFAEQFILASSRYCLHFYLSICSTMWARWWASANRADSSRREKSLASAEPWLRMLWARSSAR